MLIDCTTRGCLEKNEAKLDTSTNKVICSVCGNEINVTVFIKKALKDIGQVMRNNNKRPFQSFCPTCKSSKTLYIKDKKAYCEECDTQVVVSNAFLQGLEIYLNNKNK